MFHTNHYRNSGTNTRGASFDRQTQYNTWLKASYAPGRNPNEFRMDKCGALIRFQDYGNRNSTYGWEIDHIIPVSKGGTDADRNLQPLQWKNNLQKSDGPDSGYCVVRY